MNKRPAWISPNTTRRLCRTDTLGENWWRDTSNSAFLVLLFSIKIFSWDCFSALFSQARSGSEAQILFGFCSGPGLIPGARLLWLEWPMPTVKSMSINRLTTGCSVIRTVEYHCSQWAFINAVQSVPWRRVLKLGRVKQWRVLAEQWVLLLLMGRGAKAQCNALDVRMWPYWQELWENLTPRLSVGSGTEE